MPHEAVAAFYQPLMATTLVESSRGEVQKTVRQRLQKLRKKMGHLAAEHEKLQSYLPYQHYGTLLLTQRLPRGASSATVVDYYSPEPATVCIPLDPRLSVHDNAQMYFKKYRKTKGGLAKIQELLAQYTDEERYLEGVAQQIAHAEDWQVLQALEAELSGSQPPAGQQRRVSERPHPPASPPYRTFVSRAGYTLYCGKNHQGNEALLRQVATPEDSGSMPTGRPGPMWCSKSGRSRTCHTRRWWRQRRWRPITARGGMLPWWRSYPCQACAQISRGASWPGAR